VDNSVENFASIFKSEFKNSSDFGETQNDLCKSAKIGCEKKFQIEQKFNFKAKQKRARPDLSVRVLVKN
jgi:hypothetical protein